MTSAKLTPRAASPAHARVAEATRDSQGELALLQVRADVARLTLHARKLLNLYGRELSTAAFERWVFGRFDSEVAGAVSRNRQRFEGATNALLREGRDAFDLPTAEAYGVLRAGRAAAGVLPMFHQALLEGATAARASIDAIGDPARVPRRQCPPARRTIVVQMPWVVGVTRRKAT